MHAYSYLTAPAVYLQHSGERDVAAMVRLLATPTDEASCDIPADRDHDVNASLIVILW